MLRGGSNGGSLHDDFDQDQPPFVCILSFFFVCRPTAQPISHFFSFIHLFGHSSSLRDIVRRARISGGFEVWMENGQWMNPFRKKRVPQCLPMCEVWSVHCCPFSIHPLKTRFLHVTRPPSTPAQNAKFDERKEALLVLDSLPNLRERGSFFRGAKLFWITKSQSRET